MNNDLFLGDEYGETYQITSTGEKETIFNGKPDWVYEEEVVGTDNLLHWGSDGEFLVYVVLDDSKVEHVEYQKYNSASDSYPEMVDIAYPKAGQQNPIPIVKVVNVKKVFDGVSIQNATFEVFSSMAGILGPGYVLSSIYWFSDAENCDKYETESKCRQFVVNWQDRIQTYTFPLLAKMWYLDEREAYNSSGALSTQYMEHWAEGPHLDENNQAKGWVGKKGPEKPYFQSRP